MSTPFTKTTPPKEDGDDSVTWTLDQPEGSHPGAELQDQKELSLRTLISGVQIAGSSYSMYHNTIHKVAMPDENAFSLFIRGPGNAGMLAAIRHGKQYVPMEIWARSGKRSGGIVSGHERRGIR